MIQFVKQGLEDLAVSQYILDWGTMFHLIPKWRTVYVWFDALVNYISALSPFDGDGELYKKYWACRSPYLVLGIGIVRFSILLFVPMMLM